MMRYRWRGNVRQLEHAIERAVIVARGDTIRPRDLPPEISQQKARQRVPDDSLDLHEQERAMRSSLTH
jgi:DNA-binding NtrC family response regulator